MVNMKVSARNLFISNVGYIYMIRKLAIYMIFFTTLNGCVQGIALLGPVFSYSQSGNIAQTALSYGSNIALNKMRAKSSTENKEITLDENKTVSEDYSISLVKNKIEKASSITD